MRKSCLQTGLMFLCIRTPALSSALNAFELVICLRDFMRKAKTMFVFRIHIAQIIMGPGRNDPAFALTLFGNNAEIVKSLHPSTGPVLALVRKCLPEVIVALMDWILK